MAFSDTPGVEKQLTRLILRNVRMVAFIDGRVGNCDMSGRSRLPDAAPLGQKREARSHALQCFADLACRTHQLVDIAGR